MRMVAWEFVQLALAITMTYSSGVQSCHILTFNHHGSLDGQMFNDTFITERSVYDKAACLWWSFHDLQCNMVLHNPASQRCRLYYSSVITGGEQEAGWQYYTVACSDFRILNALSVMRNQTHEDVSCSNGFSYLPTTSGKCFHDNVPLDIGRCMQTLWIDPVPAFRTSLPAPLSSGAEIVVEAAADGVNSPVMFLLAKDDDKAVFYLTVRWSPYTIIYNTAGASFTWGAEVRFFNPVLTPKVTSVLSIKMTETQFLISDDDDSLFDVPRRLPLQEAVSLYIDFTVIKRVQINYK
ncbi:uncharacterized protein LOC124268071 [Haliotis rubra]|uniref:uncharacterized protein LOC124268071 n=1 Tax=Haliotis rubra TaxID=36100 RepID=UPI001EE4FBFC|nr:uncharacterized protein LOC124268071 [Haliotis rubra]